jgi:phosphatidylinositol glycan class W
MAIFLGLKSKATKSSRNEKRKFGEIIISKPGNFPFVTLYRGSMLMMTALCILGVDFPVFPRRFAKTENFGYGLMDIGVGSYVFAAAIVSQEARKGLDPNRSRLNYLFKSWKESIPMIVLGVLRLVTVKGSGYHEHVTEYGTHWNFFFTLAIVKVTPTR